MRVKFDGALFKQEDLDYLMQELDESGIDVQMVKKSAANRKGLPETGEMISWIMILSNAFLPVIVNVVYDYVTRHKQGQASIDIEYNNPDGTNGKIRIRSGSQPAVSDIQVKENGEVHMFITKDRQCE